MFHSEAQGKLIWIKYKLASILEEKMEGLEVQVSTLQATKQNEDFLDSSHERLPLEQPKGKRKEVERYDCNKESPQNSRTD